MTQHDPDRIHWARVLKLVNDSQKKSMSVHQVARYLEIDLNSPDLMVAVEQLVNQGRIRKVTGRDEEGGGMCVVLVITDPTEDHRRRYKE